MSGLDCVPAASEAVVLVEGPQRRELPAPPRSAVGGVARVMGAVYVFAFLVRTFYSTTSVMVTVQSFSRLRGPGRPHLCAQRIPPPAAPPSSPRSRAHCPPRPAARACSLGCACSPFHGRQPLAPAPPQWLSEQPPPGLPFQTCGGSRCCSPGPPAASLPHDGITSCTFVGEGNGNPLQ